LGTHHASVVGCRRKCRYGLRKGGGGGGEEKIPGLDDMVVGTDKKGKRGVKKWSNDKSN